MMQLAVFTKNRTNPAYEAARIGADRTAKRLGATTAHYVPDIPDDVDQQIALIDRAIATRPDAVVFVPAHETRVNQAILRFDAAGIPLFNFITRPTAGERKCFVGSDDRALAIAITRYLCRRRSGRGDIVILEGTPASATSRERFEGFCAALRDYPEIKVRASLPGEYQRHVARHVFEAAGKAVRDIAAVLCANDVMA